MNVFGNSSKQLLQALTANAEKETMDYVLQEMQAVLIVQIWIQQD